MKNRLFVFLLVLLVGLSVVSAADVIDDDSAVASVEDPQVEQANEIQDVVQSVQEGEEIVYSGDNPEPISSLTNGNSYTNAIITLGSDATFTDASVTFNDNVTLKSDNTKRTLTNLKIVVSGNNVTINNVIFNHNTTTTASVTNWVYNSESEQYVPVTTNENIWGTYSNTKVIDVTGGSNVTINNVDINLAKNQTFTTMGISVSDLSDNVTINSTNVDVYSASQGQTWVEDENHNWYSILSVSGVVFDNSTNIVFENSSVNIANTTTDFYYTTMPAITVRNATTNVTIVNNTLKATGSKYVYGTMMTDNVYNVTVKNNTVDVSGYYYVAGIDISTAKNSVACKNVISAISENASSFNAVTGDESLAYGIVSDTYGVNNENNIICLNNITLKANTLYGIEVYKGNNVTVCSNKINGNGNKSMGVAFAHTNNSKVINNNITIIGTTTEHHPFYEEITPENTGILFTNQSNNNIIQGNKIIVTGINDNSALAINLTNDTGNEVNGNYIRVNYNEDGTDYSEDVKDIIYYVKGTNTVGDNDAVNYYDCSCPCGCGTNNNVNVVEGCDNFFH